MRPKSKIYTPKRDDEHPHHFHMRSLPPPPRGDTLAMLARGQHNRILQENRVKFPEERNAFVLDYQFNMAAVTSRAKQ